MKLGPMLVFAAIVSFVFGLGLLVVPAVFFSLYGVAQSPAATLMGRLFGTALVGLGLVSWRSRSLEESLTRRVIVPAFLLSALVGLIVSLFGLISSTTNAFGLSVVILYLLLTLGFAYFQLSSGKSTASKGTAEPA